jgi:hypothetical protein
MSAYDNPKLINDQSALAWAAAAQQVSNSVVSAFDKIVKFQNDQKEVSDKKQEVFDLAWNAQSLSQYQTLSEVSDQLEDAGVQNSIIKNAQDIQKRLMNGIGKEGDEDYKMGSIEAATILKTRGVDKDEREKLNEIITKANSNLKTTTKTAGIIMTDVAQIEPFKGTPGPGRNQYWQGNTFAEQLGSQLAGFSLSNMNSDGITLDKKELTLADNGNQILTVVNTVSKDSPIIEAWGINVDNKGLGQMVKGKDTSNMYKVNDDGSVTFTFEKDMSNWDGDLLQETELATDYKTIMVDQNVLGPNGKELAEGFSTYLPETVTNSSNGRMQVQTREFVDIKKIDSIMKESLVGRLKGLYSLPPGEKKAYMEQRLGLGEVDINKFAMLNEQQQSDWLEIAEIGKMREQFGLTSTEGVVDLQKRKNPITDKLYTEDEAKEYLNQLPGFNMKRVLVDDDLLEEMTTAGVVGYNKGEYAYFEMSEPKTMAKPVRTGNSSAINTYRSKQAGLLQDPTSTQKVQGNKAQYGSMVKRMLVFDAATRTWLPKVWKSTSVSVPTTLADGTTVRVSSKEEKWVTDTTNPLLEGIDTKNKTAFTGWLGY